MACRADRLSSDVHDADRSAQWSRYLRCRPGSSNLHNVAQDQPGDAKAGVNIVTPLIRDRNGILFLIPGEVVPQVVEGDGMLEIYVIGRDPLKGVETPVHQIAHVGPPVDSVDGDADQV